MLRGPGVTVVRSLFCRVGSGAQKLVSTARLATTRGNPERVAHVLRRVAQIVDDSPTGNSDFHGDPGQVLSRRSGETN